MWALTRRKGAVVTGRANFSSDEARQVGTAIGIDWASAPFDVEQFRMGMDVELEHGFTIPPRMSRAAIRW